MFWTFFFLFALLGGLPLQGQELPPLPNPPADSADENKNQQELNYTKALVAYNKGDYGHAFSFLAKNLSDGMPPHAETLELLSMAHEKRGNLLKAIRAQYYLIKKFHGDELLKARGVEETQKRLKLQVEQHGPIGEKTLGQYFKLADLYTQLYQKESQSPPKVRDRIHQLAFKYFTICRFFQYRPEQVDYALGLLYRASGRPQEAAAHLREAREKLDQIYAEYVRKVQQDEDYAPEIEDNEELAGINEFRNYVNLYLSDSFLSMGNPDLALNYIRSTPDQDISASLKNMSRLFFDSLSEDFLVMNAAYGVGHDNNVFGLNEILQGNFNDYAEYYGRQEGYYDSKFFSAFYNSKNYNAKAFVFNFQVNETQYKENAYLSRADTRTFSGGGELKIFRDDSKGVFRLGANSIASFVRRSPQGGFSYDGLYTTLTSLADFWHKPGSLSIGPLMKFNSNQNTNSQSHEYGATLGLTPWGFSPLFSPAASLTVTRLKGGGLSSDADKYQASLSNLAQVGDFFSLLISTTYALDDAQALEDRVDLFNGNVTGIWSLRSLLSGLMFKLSWDETLTRTGEHYSDHTHRRLLTATLNLSF